MQMLVEGENMQDKYTGLNKKYDLLCEVRSTKKRTSHTLLGTS